MLTASGSRDDSYSVEDLVIYPLIIIQRGDGMEHTL